MDPLIDYFCDCAHSSLVDAENYRSQGRRARAQESLNNARYFAVKCPPESLVADFEERVREVSQG